jgi:hypothetical protein
MTEQSPRLRVERLVVIESRSPLTFIHEVTLRAGLNIVWADEVSAAEGATYVERAGHGVGKTTFSLMLRAVLGDDGTAVKTMRSHLAEHYGTGGIAAEVVAGDKRYAVFRSFGSQSFALLNGTVESMFEEKARADAVDFSTYVSSVSEEACLRRLATRALPLTGQQIEWGHVLCWIARDQALGLREYFEWRNDGGTGLRRKVKDPPVLVRLVLGLLTDAEAKAEEWISSVSSELSTARELLRREEQRGTNTRAIIESQLRAWAGVANDLAMQKDDLFAPSVEREIGRKERQLEARNNDDRAAVDTIDQELVELAADIKTQDRIVEFAKSRWEESVALRTKDQAALDEIRKRRDTLLTLSGMCQYSAIAYSECGYVESQRSTVQLSARREIGVQTNVVDERDDREARDIAEFERESEVLVGLRQSQRDKTARKSALNSAMEARARQLGERDALRRSLTQWQESRSAPETEKLRAAREAVNSLEKKLEAAQGAKIYAQQRVSERERQVSATLAKLAEQFGASGRYAPSDERRPFQMLGTDGDAYTVLEILLGDLVCAHDGASSGGAHPGVLIFDCPREREMSPHLYERFLILVDEVCKKSPGLQVVITTTTPPPGRLREPPTRILRLSRASEGDLLLKRRIENLLARTTPSLRRTTGEGEA